MLCSTVTETQLCIMPWMYEIRYVAYYQVTHNSPNHAASKYTHHPYQVLMILHRGALDHQYMKQNSATNKTLSLTLLTSQSDYGIGCSLGIDIQYLTR